MKVKKKMKIGKDQVSQLFFSLPFLLSLFGFLLSTFNEPKG